MSERADDCDIAVQLRAAFSQLGAEQGIENIALRAVSATVGRSTTAVFQHFGSKERLLLASMEEAFERDSAFHDRFLATLANLPADAQVRGATVCFYITQRSRCQDAQLWLEALFKSRQFPELRPLVLRWHIMRRDFWSRLLGHTQEAMADLLAAYTAAEEAYAAALQDEPAYHLLLRETAGRLFASPAAGAPRGAAGAWTESSLPPLAPIRPTADNETITRLLDQATRVILRRGPAGLNVRRVAADAVTAPSQIVYHFGDFATFRRQAIVEVLMRGLPAGLDPKQPAGAGAGASADWMDDLHKAATPHALNQPAGFYVNYARVLGQACLLAKRDATLRPLALRLRAIEGAGIFHLSQSQWPEPLRLDRDGATAFAIWIKGHAIVNEALGSAEHQPGISPVVQAATLLTH